MSKIIDRERVQDALNRAARNAMRGTPETRAGRFVTRARRGDRDAGAPRVSAETIKGWMDRTVADFADAEVGLRRKGDVLRLRNDLSWSIEIDHEGTFYVHYICEVPPEQVDPARFFAKHVKLYNERDFREHVRWAIEAFAPSES